MTAYFDKEIAAALGEDLTSGPIPHVIGDEELPSCFATSDLAVASVVAAASELAALTGTRDVAVNRRHALQWFDMTLQPEGWSLPSLWDAVAGDYQGADGWIRLHTNAPHHRDAALRVLDCAADREAVAQVVSGWSIVDLEKAVVAEGGAAAAMRGLEDWAAHPQGASVAQEPLIDWSETGSAGRHIQITGLKVLDLTRVLAGPVATRFLAGFGADVLRIDPPWWEEPGVVPEVGLGKRRAGLDLKQVEDRATFEALLSEAEVFVHGYRDGALSGLGYDPARLRALAPQMIEVKLNAYGWSGPWTERRGFDSLVQMSCGIAAEGMRRAGAERPVPLPVQALDHATGYLMAAAVLRALRMRRDTGVVTSARLSLARIAALLTSHGARDFTGQKIEHKPEDFDPAGETTFWGPARRIRFPVNLDGKGPAWRHSAGPLRCDPPRWTD